MKDIYLEQELSQNPTLNPSDRNHELGSGVEEGSSPSISVRDVSIWAESGLDIAIASIERVRGSLIRSAELFREDDSTNANRFFIQCVEGLQRFMEAVRNTKAALNLDFSKISTEMGTLQDTEKSLLFILRGMFINQERKEYDAIADKIEYELITNVSSWIAALKSIRQSRMISYPQ